MDINGMLILSLYIKETNANKSLHPPPTCEEYKRDGCFISRLPGELLHGNIRLNG
jgi:hypothetical protein